MAHACARGAARRDVSARRAHSTWTRRIGWTTGTIAFFVASAYVVGGPALFRFRSRAAALLEPPTQAQLQAVDTLSASSTAAVIPGNEPVGIGYMSATLLLIVLVVGCLLLISARSRR